MTIASTVDRVQYLGAGSAGPYAYPFRVRDVSHLVVTTRDLTGIETTLTSPSDFTATGIGDREGGTITLTIDLATNWTLVIRRAIPLTQGASFRNQGPYFAETVEDTFDDACIRDQTLAATILGSVKLPETVDPAVFDTTLPTVLTPGDAVVVNATGNGFSMGALSAATLSAWSAAHNQKLDVYTSSHSDFVAGTTTTLTLSAAPGGVANISVTLRVSGVDKLLLTDEFSIASTTLTFASPIPTGTTRVEVRYFYTYQINTADAANVTYAPASGPGTTVQTRLRSLDAAVSVLPNRFDYLYAKDYGVVGDGTTDDTTALQSALTAGAAQFRVVSCGNLVVKVTSGLTMAGPGLVFNQCSYGAPGDPGILVSGTGYTALTTTGTITQLTCCIYGTGNAAKAFYFNNPQQSTIQHIRAYNLAGWGCKIDKCWDCDFYSISVELCNAGADYSFSMNGAGDTCNQSTIHHLQVERHGARGIFVDPSSLVVAIRNIHSEQGNPTAGVDTWVLAGASSQFQMCRFAPNSSANATLHLAGENCTFETFRVEGSTVTKAEANSGVSINLIGCNLATLKNLGSVGQVNVYGGTAVLVKADPGLRMEDTIITTLECGLSANPPDPTLEQFHTCTIGTLTSTSALSAATFTNCTITECSDWLEGHTVLDRCTVASASTINGSGAATLRDTTVNANTLMAGASSLFATGLTRFNGTLGQSTDCSSLIGPEVYATGAVTGLGIPTKQPAANANVGAVWRRGQMHWNLAPSAAGPPGWVCTTGGGNGVFVFKAMASLAP